MFALKETLKHIQSKEIKLIIEKFLTGDHKLNYNEFAISISKVLVGNGFFTKRNRSNSYLEFFYNCVFILSPHILVISI